MNTMAGLATSSTAMVSRLRCSTDRPLMAGSPTMALDSAVSSTKSMTCAQVGMQSGRMMSV